MTVNLTYEKFGEPSNSTVVLIHPFPFRAEFWQATAPQLAEAGFQVIAPNLRGCADSPSDDADADINLLAADIWELLDRLDISKVTIMGVSLGGYVTLAMLRARPESVTALGLIDTKVTADSPAAIRNRTRIATEIQTELTPPEYALQMLPTLLSAFTHEHRPEVVTKVQSWISVSKPETIAWLQHAMAGRPDSSSDLAAFRGKTLLLRGADDVVTKAEDFNTMNELAQLPTYVEIPNCGHLPPVEDPQRTVSEIISWLTGE